MFTGFRRERSANALDYEGLFVPSLSVALPVKRSSARAGTRALSVLLGEVDEVIMARGRLTVPVSIDGSNHEICRLIEDEPGAPTP